MKKRVCAAVLAASVFAMAFTGCTGANQNETTGETVDVVEETMTEAEPEKYMTIDAYGGYGVLSATMEGGEKEETVSWDFALVEGLTIADVLKESGITSIEVLADTSYEEYSEDETREEDEEYAETEAEEETEATGSDAEAVEAEGFEGWIEYKIDITYDDEGWSEYRYEKMSGDTYYTTEELMAKTAPDYDVLYVAKWADVSINEYFKMYEIVDDGLMLFLSVYSNGGEIMCGEEDPYAVGLGVYSVETGYPFGVMMSDESPITSVEREGYTFAGWDVYTGDMIEWVEEEVTELDETSVCLEFGDYGYAHIQNYKTVGEGLTTEELYEVVCEGTEYVAIASWE